ncbi:extracellular solute-binding protein [Hominenteromicrobium sp.]|uniref:extracellular solute-binding protein n=1 Tax=Hominenteromicrobium sp. TaxID=3073581 RepID=UPI003AB5B2AF
MKRRLNKSAGAFLAFLVTAGILSGCGAAADRTVCPKNDIVTMSAVDTDKMTITIRAEYNVSNEGIRRALETKFPDVNFVSVFHCSLETQYELRQSLQGGSAEDLVISPNMKSIADIAPETLLDLSGEAFIEGYTGLALEACQIDGKLYYLPGPSSVYGIVYDKTLFKENGWKLPGSYDEFIALVKTINAAGLRAIQPTCKYARQAQLMFTMFDYDQVFGGVENYRWIKDYQSGSESMKNHIEPALARYRDLQAANVIEASDFDMQPGNRSTMLYNDHTCAMIVENEQAALYAKQAESDHEYGMFPFWCGNDPNSDKVMSIPGYYVGINAALSQQGNEKKLAKVKEVLAYISTPEGQLAISGGELLQMSNVSGTKLTENDFNAGIMDTIRKGNAVPEVELMSTGNGNPAEKALKADLRKYLEGSISEADLITDCDAARTGGLNSPVDRGQVIGQASDNFTCLETGLFIADSLREKADAQIGLCLVGTTHCGMVGRIYKGDICTADISSLSLSVGTTSGDPNDKKLWRVSMTGAELTELLKTACAFDPNDNVPNIPYYVASGLKIRIAPWQADKLLSVTMADGSKLQADQSYTVALWGWPFETGCPGTVEQVYDDSCDEILEEAVKNAGTVTPDNHGRFAVIYP